MSRRQQGRWAQQAAAEQPAPAAAPPPPTQPAGGADNTIAQLKELGELKAQGVLTDAEFEEQKRRVLGS